MKWLLDEKGNIVLRNGKPVAVGADGQEFEYDIEDRNNKFVATVAEATKNRKDKAELKQQLEAIPEEVRTDPASYVTAYTKFSSLDDKNKADMAKLESDLKASYDTAAKEKDDRIVGLENQLYQEKVTTKFATSGALKDTIFNDTRDLAESYFGKHFTVDKEGQMVGTKEDGSIIYSKENPGQAADFDECLSTLINSHPKKDNFISASNQRGTGEPPNKGEHQKSTSSLESIEAGISARKGQ